MGVDGMGLENVAKAVETITGFLDFGGHGVGFYVAMAGILVFAVFAVAALGLLVYRGFKSIFDMTPSAFLRFILVSAGILVLVGALLP